MVQRHWLLWLIISYYWPCSNILAFPSEPAYQAALNAAPSEGAALGRTPRHSSAERGREGEGAGGSGRGTRRLELSPPATLRAALAAAPAELLSTPEPWIKICALPHEVNYAALRGPLNLVSVWFGGLCTQEERKEFCWDSRYFYLWDGGGERGGEKDWNKTKANKERKTILLMSKALFGNFKTNALLLLKALIFFPLLKRSP